MFSNCEHASFPILQLHATGRFCWSILQTNEQTLKAFLEKNLPQLVGWGMLSGELSKQTTLTLRLIGREFLGGISLEDYLALHIVFSKCKVIYFSKSKTRMNIFWQRCVCVFSMDYPTIYICYIVYLLKYIMLYFIFIYLFLLGSVFFWFLAH